MNDFMIDEYVYFSDIDNLKNNFVEPIVKIMNENKNVNFDYETKKNLAVIINNIIKQKVIDSLDVLCRNYWFSVIPKSWVGVDKFIKYINDENNLLVPNVFNNEIKQELEKNANEYMENDDISRKLTKIIGNKEVDKKNMSEIIRVSLPFYIYPSMNKEDKDFNFTINVVSDFDIYHSILNVLISDIIVNYFKNISLNIEIKHSDKVENDNINDLDNKGILKFEMADFIKNINLSDFNNLNNYSKLINLIYEKNEFNTFSNITLGNIITSHFVNASSSLAYIFGINKDQSYHLLIYTNTEVKKDGLYRLLNDISNKKYDIMVEEINNTSILRLFLSLIDNSTKNTIEFVYCNNI